MMIPERIHCDHDLPGNAPWLITKRRGKLVVYLAPDVPPDSPLEQHFVRQATRMWRARHHGIAAIPVIAGAGWLARKLGQPRTVAVTGASVVAAGVALAAAVTLTEPPEPARHRPPTAAAPPTWQPTRPPHTAPTRPGPPPKTTPKRTHPQPPGRDEVDAGALSVELPARPHLDVPDVPAVRARTPVTAPRVPTPPVTVTPPPPAAGRCRLVEVQLGQLVRVCL